MGLEYLLNISYTDEPEVFKVCLDYWHVLVCDLYQSRRRRRPRGGAEFFFAPRRRRRRLDAAHAVRGLDVAAPAVDGEPHGQAGGGAHRGGRERDIVRETLKDNDVLVQYKIMRETLIYLAHLDHKDTETQMLEKLSNQLNGKEYSWNVLNTLCWAIGSISGSMAEDRRTGSW